VEHAAAQSLERPFPWRTIALAAGAVSLAELLVLLVVAGVRLAPASHARAATTATRATATTRTHRAAPAPAPTPARAKPQPLRPRSRVSVLVLNGNGITGAAGREASTLLHRGYRTASSADAPNHDYARSLVLYAPGYLREGKRLARDAGVRVVGPLDGLRPSQLRGSQLVVILGDS